MKVLLIVSLIIIAKTHCLAVDNGGSDDTSIGEEVSTPSAEKVEKYVER